MMIVSRSKIKKFALNLQLQAIQILTNDVQMIIFCLFYFITTVIDLQLTFDLDILYVYSKSRNIRRRFQVILRNFWQSFPVPLKENGNLGAGMHTYMQRGNDHRH